MIWAEEWTKEGKKIDWQRLMPPRGFKVLPRRWVVERAFSCLDQNRRMSLGTTKGCAPPPKRYFVVLNGYTGSWMLWLLRRPRACKFGRRGVRGCYIWVCRALDRRPRCPLENW
jgi:hypothetical protein